MSQLLSVRWRLAGAFFLIIAVLVSLVGFYLYEWTKGYYIKSISDDLRRECAVVGRINDTIPPADLPSYIAKVGKDLEHRITIIDLSGKVLADSEHDFKQMVNHLDRPEVRQAIATGYGTSTRYSSTLKTRMLYVAIRISKEDQADGIVRIAEPLSGLNEVISTIQGTFEMATLAAVLLAALLSFKLSISIVAPIEGISTAARRLARGDLTARASQHVNAANELRDLAATFNHMAQQLQSTVQEITEQKARMQAVFDRTDDGLMLIGSEGDVQMINPAACRVLEIECADSVGKTVIEGTLNHDLASLVSRTANNGEPAALDVGLLNDAVKEVHAYVAPIPRLQGKSDVLVVLHDVTASRQIDKIRRDFVANVSHELRTPLATIKAMAETIVLRSAGDASIAPQFAASIVQEADRMTALAEDLLELAKAETGQRTLNKEVTNVQCLVADVFERLKIPAEKKSIELISEVDEADIVHADYDALSQIIVNLVDNSIKYTHTGGRVIVSATQAEDHLAIRITDNGMGIPPEDLSRVFERFYRVDKGRSRQSGGTGLGLSIVKHITELLNGNVSVTSELGKGTTFSVILPV